MLKIFITDKPNQKMTQILENGETVQFQFKYNPTTTSWLIYTEYKNYKNNGRLITVSDNILRNAKNILPFGILCIANNGQEPTNLSDFEVDNAELFITNSTERDQLTQLIIGNEQVTA